jgi:8-oxo-dGTP pyrophosphatase MutT (NUDIX family)
MSERRFDEPEVRRLAKTQLLNAAPLTHAKGDDDLVSYPEGADIAPNRVAAVLMPLIARRPEVTVLLTQRTEQLAMHAGQISFPGGRVEETDSDVVMTAIRETYEETGLTPEFIEPIGFLEAYLTSSRFCIVPVVAVVHCGFALAPAKEEVAAIFEVPLRFLMTPDNYAVHSRQWLGRERRYYALTFGERYIWGATAAILKNFCDRMYRQ